MAQFSSFELKEFDSASLTGSLQNLGSALSNPAYEMTINNDSDVHAYISADGTNNTWRIADGQSLVLRAKDADASLDEASILLKSGVQLKIKQVTGAGTGFITANISTVG